jgi:hypothetical protein
LRRQRRRLGQGDKGETVPAGRVTFLCQGGDNRAITAPIKDGVYTITNCPAGQVKISVETFPPAAANPSAPPGVPPEVAKGFESGQNANPFASPPGQYVQLPPRYANPDKSGLTYTVTGGKQEHPLELGE